MQREQSYLSILEATAQIQLHISIILEAKATEAEKMRGWICNHVSASSFNEDHKAQVKYAIEIHEQLIGVVDGLTKMENGLAQNLKVILGQEQGGSSLELGDSDLFDFGGQTK
jgi:hypothetical protein